MYGHALEALMLADEVCVRSAVVFAAVGRSIAVRAALCCSSRARPSVEQPLAAGHRASLVLAQHLGRLQHTRPLQYQV